MELASYVGALTLLGDERRLRLCALLDGRELSVSSLVRVTGLSQPRVSTHLARLREAGYVRLRRDGQHTYYALAGEALPPTARLVLDGAKATGDPALQGDAARLRALDAAPRGRLPGSFAGEMERHYSPGRTWQSLCEGLAALLSLGDVLDLGSGDAAASARLVARCRSLTCVDASREMVAAAARRLRGHRHARAVVADAAALPFDDGSFDQALLFHTLAYVERPDAVLAECARVLRPGGRLVALSLDRHAHRELTARFGERHAGFSARELTAKLTRAGLVVGHAAVACTEPKKPHFRVVLCVADKPTKPKPRERKP
ncbi:MAG: metalloregulator ArsR/SmtB family transcription factor [Polyangiaceae bacterium]|nr:metalloregulator ArsR/SmtB family transcription factor [Polyangiaceae bacterium]